MSLKTLCKSYLHRYTEHRAWQVECTDEFEEWWEGLSEATREDIDVNVRLLEARGPRLGFPYSSCVRCSRHSRMRELRVRSGGKPWRILYAFDPRRRAILLAGGNKTGDDRWYQRFVPEADRLYDRHLVDICRRAQPVGT